MIYKRTVPTLIIHAGAGIYPKNIDRAKKIQEKLRNLSEKGYQFLKNHSAVDAALEITRQLEDWPETNAGIGSVLQSDGKARLSAALMDGSRMRFSGVINIEQIKNPILAAGLLQKERDRVLAGEGAEKFAWEKGFKLCDVRTKERLKQWKTWLKTPSPSPLPLSGREGNGSSPHPNVSDKTSGEGVSRGKFGTVGVCALDSKGHLAAATSTGGKGMERAGRVSDSALPAGNYANLFAAVSATGLGEDIIEEALASTIAVRARDFKNLAKAFQKTFAEARKRKRLFGAIGVDRSGNIMAAKTTGILYYAFQTRKKSGVFPI